MNKPHVLRPYQQNAIRYMRGRNAWALFMEMRLGKTLVTIRAIKQRKGINKILIVAPYSALDGWKQELTRESQAYIQLEGPKGKRLADLDIVETGGYSKRIWVLVNKESHLSIGQQLKDATWDAVVLDESTFIKAPPRVNESARFGKRLSITKYFLSFPESKLRVILTGTPAPESQLDYFAQLAFLDPEILGHKTYWEFRAKCFHKYAFNFIMHKSSQAWLAERLARHTFQLKRSDVNLGGVKVYETRICVLPSDVRAAYNTCEKEFVLEYNGVFKKTLIAGVKYQWIRQLSDGFTDGKTISVHKLNLLKELLTGELKGQQVVIWAQYVAEVLAISKMLSVDPIYGKINPAQRVKICHGFQASKVKYLVCQPETMKFGVRMDAADTMIYFSTTESSLTRMQTEDRIVDVGKSNGVLIIDLVTENTVDEDIQASLDKKESMQVMMTRLINAAKKRQNLL